MFFVSSRSCCCAVCLLYPPPLGCVSLDCRFFGFLFLFGACSGFWFEAKGIVKLLGSLMKVRCRFWLVSRSVFLRVGWGRSVPGVVGVSFGCFVRWGDMHIFGLRFSKVYIHMGFCCCIKIGGFVCLWSEPTDFGSFSTPPSWFELDCQGES